MLRVISHISNCISLTALLLFITHQSGVSQIKWVDGYIIQNDGEKIQCLIKNLDWKSNPSSFKWKPTEEANPQTADIESVKEFTIGNSHKYIRDTVLIDHSQNNLRHLSNKASPEYQEKVVFLKVLIDGLANLYVYEHKQTKNFFYSTPEIRQSKALTYKKYRVPGSSIIKENDEFKAQLWKDLNCSTISTQYISNLDYNQDNLVDYFKRYNVCQNVEYVNYNQYKTKAEFRLHLKGGIELTYANFRSTHDNPFDPKLAYRIETELEYALPFHKNKWSVLIAPSYLFYQGEGTLKGSSPAERSTSLKLHALEFNLGGRHYFYLKNGQSIFVNSGISLSYPIGSELYIEDLFILNVSFTPSMFLGVGFDLSNSLNVELKMSLFRSHTWNGLFLSQFALEYDYYALQIGYRLF